jgi:hypothetical protein
MAAEARILGALASLLVLAAIPTETRGASQVQTGAIRGSVHDSTRSIPLADARVILWDTPHETRTDEAGSFHFPELPEGEYALVFFHERLSGLGIASGSHSVTVTEGRTASLALATPSMPTIQSTLCALDEGLRDSDMPPPPRVTGQVVDAVTGFPAPGVPVEASWRGEGGGAPRMIRGVTDREGWYRLCGLPAGTTVGVRAELGQRVAPRRQFLGAPGSLVHLDLALAPATGSVVQGLVVARDGGGRVAPVEGAGATLEGTAYRTITDPSGRFRFSELSPGEYTLIIEHPSFGPRRDDLVVEPGTDIRVEGELTERAIAMAPLTVTVRSAFEARALAMGGRLVSRDDIERVLPRSRDVADLLHHQRVPGLIVKKGTGVNRSCVEYVQGASRMFRTTCESVQVYVDNVRSVDPEGAIEIPSDVVDRMILFRPVEAGNLFGLGSGSGVLLIFTKSGGRR